MLLSVHPHLLPGYGPGSLGHLPARLVVDVDRQVLHNRYAQWREGRLDQEQTLRAGWLLRDDHNPHPPKISSEMFHSLR